MNQYQNPSDNVNGEATFKAVKNPGKLNTSMWEQHGSNNQKVKKRKGRKRKKRNSQSAAVSEIQSHHESNIKQESNSLINGHHEEEEVDPVIPPSMTSNTSSSSSSSNQSSNTSNARSPYKSGYSSASASTAVDILSPGDSVEQKSSNHFQTHNANHSIQNGMENMESNSDHSDHSDHSESNASSLNSNSVPDDDEVVDTEITVLTESVPIPTPSPIVHAVLVFTKSMDKTERIRLVDAEANALSTEMAKMSESDDLMTYAKAFAFARPSGSLLKLQGIPNCNEYVMFTLDLSDNEVATFVLEQDPTEMGLLPLIDGTLSHFLWRTRVYQCGSKQNAISVESSYEIRGTLSILCLCLFASLHFDVTVHGTTTTTAKGHVCFSTEEAFRTLDTTGSGTITLREWKHYLLDLTPSTVTESKLELLFNAISNSSDSITRRQFEAFFKSSNHSTNSMMTSISHLNGHHGLGTLTEHDPSEQIQSLKSQITASLLLDEGDVLSEMNGVIGFDAVKALQHIECCHEFAESMKYTLSKHDSDSMEFQKWSNRLLIHQSRITFFRAILLRFSRMSAVAEPKSSNSFNSSKAIKGRKSPKINDDDDALSEIWSLYIRENGSAPPNEGSLLKWSQSSDAVDALTFRECKTILMMKRKRKSTDSVNSGNSGNSRYFKRHSLCSSDEEVEVTLKRTKSRDKKTGSKKLNDRRKGNRGNKRNRSSTATTTSRSSSTSTSMTRMRSHSGTESMNTGSMTMSTGNHHNMFMSNEKATAMLSQTVTVQKKEIKKLRSELKRLEEELQSERVKARKLKRQHHRKSSNMSMMVKEKSVAKSAATQRDRSELKMELKRLRDRLQEEEDRNRKLRSKLAHKNKEQEQRERLRTKKENISGSAILQGKVKRMEKEAERLKEEMKRKELRTEQLIASWKETEKICRSQQDEVARLEVELSNHERREEKLQNRNEALLEQNEDLQATVEQMEEDLKRTKESIQSLRDEKQHLMLEKADLEEELAVRYRPQLAVQRVLGSTSFGWHIDRDMISQIQSVGHHESWTSSTFLFGIAEVVMECTPNALLDEEHDDDEEEDSNGDGHLLLWVSMKGAVDLQVNVESPQIGFECTADIEGISNRFQSVAVGDPIPHRILEHLEDDDGLYFVCSISENVM